MTSTEYFKKNWAILKRELNPISSKIRFWLWIDDFLFSALKKYIINSNIHFIQFWCKSFVARISLKTYKYKFDDCSAKKRTRFKLIFLFVSKSLPDVKYHWQSASEEELKNGYIFNLTHTMWTHSFEWNQITNDRRMMNNRLSGSFTSKHIFRIGFIQLNVIFFFEKLAQTCHQSTRCCVRVCSQKKNRKRIYGFIDFNELI